MTVRLLAAHRLGQQDRSRRAQISAQAKCSNAVRISARR
jgi:hypothetical protein